MIVMPLPLVAINDQWMLDDSIDVSPVATTVTHPLVATPPNYMPERYQCDWYKYVALDIVTESAFKYPYPYITEKVLRSFACKRMFIYLGPANVLALLHSKGFKTFDGFIDESYDSIEDPKQRFLKVVDVVHKFLNRPIEEIQNYISANSDIFEHNLKTLAKLEVQELDRICRQLNIPNDQD
jgi:hypothetical protein